MIVGEDDLPQHDDLMIVAFQVGGPNEIPEKDIYICNVGSAGGAFSNVAPVDATERWPISLANARLIAAAPMLLNTLKKILTAESDVGPWQMLAPWIMEQAKKAILRAEPPEQNEV